jgi:hypothetical protein
MLRISDLQGQGKNKKVENLILPFRSLFDIEAGMWHEISLKVKENDANNKNRP